MSLIKKAPGMVKTANALKERKNYRKEVKLAKKAGVAPPVDPQKEQRAANRARFKEGAAKIGRVAGKLGGKLSGRK